MALDLGGFLGAAPPAPFLLAALLAGLVRGYTGFGSAMIFMPVASAYVGPQAAIGVMLLTDGVLQLFMMRGAWRHARFGDMGPLFIGYIVGMPLGVYLLVTLDPTPLRWATSLSILVGMTILASGRRIATEPGKPAMVATGAVAGVISGAASLGGMVLSLFWLAGPARNEAVRGSSVWFFFFASLFSGTLLAIAGVFSWEVARLSVWAGVPYGIGMAVGMALFGVASPALFRPAAFVIIAIAAVTSLPLLDPWLR